MTITNGYATLAQLRARLGFATADTADDTILEAIVAAVSRWIDLHCGRRFWVNSVAEARYYTATDSDLLLCPDDVVTVTALACDEDGDRVYERTWAATDYDLEPYNATLDGQPYTRIAVTPNGQYAFPTMAKAVKVTGTFGWSAVPDAIREACLLQAERIYKRKDAPFGVLGSAEMGQTLVIPKLDPDVALLLWPYTRQSVGA